MDEMAAIDPDFQPQSRPRSCTWPMKRPNIGGNQENENNVSIKLEPTIEEDAAQEQIMVDSVLNSNGPLPNLKQEIQDNLMLGSGFPVSNYGSSINTQTINSVTDYSNILAPQTQAVTANDSSSSNISFINLEPLNNYGASGLSTTPQTTNNNSPNFLNESSVSPVGQLLPVSANADSTATNSSTTTKPKSSSRKNAWGNLSYADLITQAIESTPDKRLTLAQIYDWMVKNVPYFKDKGDSNSSAGWKNSIRHNLSLHAKFKRIQNEGTGKSSWWVINHDAKPGKPNRRRTTSLDTSNPKFNKSRNKALKKSEMLKKQKSCGKRDSPPTWAKSSTGPNGLPDYEHPSFNKSLISDFRPRTSSDASSIGGRISPPRSILTQDLEDDGPPPLSPLSSSSFAAPSSALDLFENFEMQNAGELLENINIDLATSSPTNDTANIYLNLSRSGTPQKSYTSSSPMYIHPHANSNSIGSKHSQQLPSVSNAASNSNKNLLTSPNLASLLQKGSKSQQNKLFHARASSSNTQAKRHLGVDISNGLPRERANTMPKLQPQPNYDMSASPMRRQQSGESLAQGGLVLATYSAPESQQQLPSSEASYGQYPFGSSQRQQSIQLQQRQQSQEGLSTVTNQNKTIYQLLGQPRNGNAVVSQSPVNANRPQSNSVTMTDPRNCVQIQNYMALQQNSSNDFASLSNDSNYPADLNSIDNRDMFDPGALDIEQMLQDIRTPENDVLGMEFNSYLPQENNFDLPAVNSNSMDTNTGSISANATNFNKMPENSVTGYFASTHLTTEPNFLQQQRQHQATYGRSFNIYGVGENQSAELLIDTNTPSSSSMLIPRPTSSGVANHFNYPHQMLLPQSSVGTISDYRM